MRVKKKQPHSGISSSVVFFPIVVFVFHAQFLLLCSKGWWWAEVLSPTLCSGSMKKLPACRRFAGLHVRQPNKKLLACRRVCSGSACGWWFCFAGCCAGCRCVGCRFVGCLVLILRVPTGRRKRGVQRRDLVGCYHLAANPTSNRVPCYFCAPRLLYGPCQAALT